MINETGRPVNGRKINYISLDDAYSPPKTVEQIRPPHRKRRGAVSRQSGRHGDQYGCGQIYQSEKKCHIFSSARGATVFNDPVHYPWTVSWTPHYASEGEIYAKYILSVKPGAKDRHPVAERRSWPRLSAGIQSARRSVTRHRR